MTPDTVTLAAGLTAALGLFVAYQAYRGYRRNGSTPMAYLAVGIVCFTTIPFVLTEVLAPTMTWSDGLTLLGVVTAYNVGLVAIHWSLR